MKLRYVTALAAAGALAAPAVAAAHISIHPNTIPEGGFPTLNVTVPGEQDNAHVTKVDVLFPPGFIAVNTENVPGWSVKVVTQKLATPVQTDSGPVDTEISQLVWSWTGPLGRVDNNTFIQFPLSVAIPDLYKAGQQLTFKTLQTYSNGMIVRWIGPLSADKPAPTINISAKNGPIQDIAGTEAGPPPPGQTSGTAGNTGAAKPAKATSGASKGLGITALVIGALGLLAALGALATRRRTAVGS